MHSARQLHLDLRSPADHAELFGKLAPKASRLVWLPQQKPAWRALPHDRLRDELVRHSGVPDVYLTPNEFYGWRRTSLLAGLHALFVDIDDHSGGQVDRMGMSALAISKIERAGIPEPNAIVYTGRGIHLYWLIEPLPARALPRWQACQRQLCEVLGGDKQSVDCTRVLRVVGSVNSKTGGLVTAELSHPDRYEFDWISDQILPVTRDEVRKAKAERVQVRDIRPAQAKAGVKRGKSVKGSIYERWYQVYQDLWRIVDANDWRTCGVPKGKRDRLLFMMANALSWFTVSDALEAEIIDVARRLTPTLTEREVLSYCSSVLARARADAAKDDGKRYRYKRETLWNALSDLIEPHAGLVDQLRAIVPDDVREQRERERLRQRDGVKMDRTTYLATADERREEALRLRERGLSWKAVGEILGVSATAARLLASRQKRSSPPLV
ncbi:DNA-primase RepB domain-containing protein [Crenobacter intestini]|uniref:Uncharacterized protein n=1 Tax=Crenobacter intestini TaxID=2563443 RepID=A0A4T0UIX7_9NEIS|nr:DNA-primase RepB domain-containing protein [Crenobacter intestini]TIC78487.1 hypothetical protein E5K04_16045 [Crenobacter intestini]